MTKYKERIDLYVFSGNGDKSSSKGRLRHATRDSHDFLQAKPLYYPRGGRLCVGERVESRLVNPLMQTVRSVRMPPSFSSCCDVVRAMLKVPPTL